jgi:DNA-binding ferritin-like protein (Dps family)
VEHKEIKDVSGAEVDEWIIKTEKYVDRFEKLLKDLELNRKVFDVQKNYEVMVKASVAALKSLNKLPKEPEKLPEAFKKYLVEAGLVSPFYSNIFEKVITMRKMVDDKQVEKITDRDVYMSKEYVRRFIEDVRRFVDKPIQVPEGNVEEKVEKIEKIAESVKEVKVSKKKAKKK